MQNTKKPKMTMYLLITVILIAVVAVGCTFPGAKTESDGLKPDTVALSQPRSAASPPVAITDAQTVEYFWNLYQSFEFDGRADTTEKENEPGIEVAFSDGSTGEVESFCIYQNGLCTLGDNYATCQILKNGADIYKVFLRYFEAENSAVEMPQVSVELSSAIDSETPDAVIDYAKEYVQQVADSWNEGVLADLESGLTAQDASMLTEARIVGLTQITTGTSGLNDGLVLYLPEYRLLPENADSIELDDGMQTELIDGKQWLTERSAAGQPYLLLHYDSSGNETVWQRVCATDSDTIETEYGTTEMLDRYGDMFTAAAVELYAQYSE